MLTGSALCAQPMSVKCMLLYLQSIALCSNRDEACACETTALVDQVDRY